MTIQTIAADLYFPDFFAGIQSGRLVGANQTVSADTNELGMLFNAPTTGSITGCSFNITAETGIGNTYDVRLETVVSGTPSGTLAGTNTLLTAQSGTGLKSIVFTAPYSATAGDALAIVIKANLTVAGVLTLLSWGYNGGAGLGQGGPNIIQKNTGSWAALGTTSANAPSPNMAINYGGTYYPIPGITVWDSSGNNATAITNGKERGIQFKLPFPVQIRGWYCNGGPAAAGANFTVTLYTDNGASAPTSRLTKAYNSLLANVASGSASYGYAMRGYFDTPYTLAANTVADLAIAQTTANQFTINEAILLDTATAAMAGAWPGGTNCKGINGTTGAAYTVSNTRRPYGMGIIITGADDGAGASGAGPFSRIFTGM